MLWTDGDSVGDGASKDLRHGIGVFGRVEIQPGILGILFQQALALEAATYTLTDQLNQCFQIVLGSFLVGALLNATRPGARFDQLGPGRKRQVRGPVAQLVRAVDS